MQVQQHLCGIVSVNVGDHEALEINMDIFVFVSLIDRHSLTDAIDSMYCCIVRRAQTSLGDHMGRIFSTNMGSVFRNHIQFLP